ncbi:DegT/DnrJ/EryC1/StrS family aminotransferase [Streptomyces lydicus]|uniref:DegT/DnrJ/EryC1/StrS family aminotransferase n=1 Tax=Streptomyces lydicus TaxID=47763 RepID=UPI0036FB1497
MSINEALALHGGPQAVTIEDPHFVWPVIDQRTHSAVARQLDESVSLYDRSGVIARLEDKLRQRTGVEHALLTNSGTSALHTMYIASGIGPGDEVICPAYTFFATATPLLFTGAVPVFADSGPDGNIDPAAAEAAITSRTKAIVITHMWGLPCDMDALMGIAQRYNLLLLEDISHAFGATYQGQPVGSFGHAAAQSLQGQKPLTGGEGGVLLTNSSDVHYNGLAVGHYNVRCKREIPTDHQLSEFAVTGMGLKFRIHPLAAAIAEQQLDSYDEIQRGRDRVAARMADVLGQLPGLEVIQPSAGATSSWYALLLRVTDDVPGRTTAAELEKALHAEGATEVDRPGSTRPLPQLPLFQKPEALFPAYANHTPQPVSAFPQANAFHEGILKLPVWHRNADNSILEAYLAAFTKVWAHLERHGRL